MASDFVISAKQIGIKNVFPRTPAHRPGFDLAQADLTQRKYTQRVEQRTRQILHRESNRSLVGAGNHPASFADQKKSGEVTLVVLNTRRQNPAFVHGRSLTTCDPGSVP